MGKVEKVTKPSKDENPRKNVKKVSSYKKPSYKKKIFTKGGKQGKDGKTSSESSPASGAEKWSKSKKKRMRKILGRQKKEQDGDKRQKKASDEATTLPNSLNPSTAPATPTATTTNDNKKKNSMQEGFKARLAGSRFRILNEELYTTTSKNSYDKFKENPELFEQYHEGFRHQVESWPENPVDVMVRSLTSTHQKKTQKATAGPCVVADFGCGDAQLAKDLLTVKRISRSNGEPSDEDLFEVHSFDLVSPNKLVTACDMANVPLEDKSVDVCVFCLSLMGTNLADFIREAHRVLKDDGRVKIAEVRSRIEYSFSRNAKDSKKSDAKKDGKKESSEKTEGTLEEFTGVLGKLGFECIHTDRTNTMFLMLELKKNRRRPNKKLTFSAKPCIYKRR
jgi:SAM-dependent methyltransferase